MKTNRSVAVCALSFLSLLLPASAHARGSESWTYHPPGVAPDPGALAVPCGRYGSFSFEIADTGESSPPAYPSPAPGNSAALPGAKSAAWTPCAGAECFRSVLELDPETPWVAVIDWNNPHGWSVGWTIRHLADAPLKEIQIVLFALDDPEMPLADTGATDRHVLKQLCEIAEIADDPQYSPPLVINMSFGRSADDEPEDAGTCETEHLSCQIARVLHHLACAGKNCAQMPLHSLRTVPVAAAGNQGRQQFPASLPGVVAAGSLQLGLFTTKGTAGPSWETPTYPGKAQAWLPGYGICLERESGKEQWPAPPGTSYAAAVLSGWLAFAMRLGPVEDALSSDAWFPVQENKGIFLAHGERRYRSSPAIRRFFDLLLRPESGPCSASAANIRQTVEIEAEKVDPLEAGRLFEQMEVLAGGTKSPAPTDRPCVPCIGVDTSRPPENRLFAKSGEARLVIANLTPTLESALFAGYPTLGDIPEITLESLYLRRQGELFQLGRDSSSLHWLHGESFAISGVKISPGDQPSLIYVYSRNGLPLWTSVPLLVRAAEKN